MGIDPYTPYCTIILKIISILTAEYVNVAIYQQLDCSASGQPKAASVPQKVVSFLPDQCYQYDVKSVKVSVSANKPYMITYNIYSTSDCSLAPLATNYNDGVCAAPYQGVGKWAYFKVGPPQSASSKGSTPPFLYFEKIATTSVCEGISNKTYYNARTMLSIGQCTYNDYSDFVVQGVSGDATSITFANDVSICTGAATMYYGGCNILGPHRIANAFLTATTPTTNEGYVEAVSYTAINLTNLDFGYNLHSKSFGSIVLVPSVGSPVDYKPGYSFIISKDMTFINLPNPFQGLIRVYQDSFDYIKNTSIPFIKTNSFSMPLYPTINQFDIVSVTTDTIQINFTSIGGFNTDGGNVYQVTTQSPGSQTWECLPATVCTLDGLPIGAMVYVTVKVTNFGQSQAKIQQVQLKSIISNLGFDLVPSYKAINISFTLGSIGEGPVTYTADITDLTTSTTRSSTTSTQSYIVFPASSTPTNYTIKTSATNSGTILNYSRNFIWLGDIKLNTTFNPNTVAIKSLTVYNNVSNLANSTSYVAYFYDGDVLVYNVTNKTAYLKIDNLRADTNYNLSSFIVDPLTSRRSNIEYVVFKTYANLSNFEVAVTQRKNETDATKISYTFVMTWLGGSPLLSFAHPSMNYFPGTGGALLNTNVSNIVIGVNIPFPFADNLYYAALTTAQDNIRLDKKVFINYFPFPNITSLDFTTGHDTVNFTWAGINGVPGNITYGLSIFNPLTPQVAPYTFCIALNLGFCNVSGLIPSTDYSFTLTMKSDQFDPVTRSVSVQTIQSPISPCMDLKLGANNTIDCNGFGQCLNGTCLCVNNRVGIYCETPTTDQGGNSGNGTNVDPNPSVPEIIINNKNIFYEFVISQIREVDIEDNTVKMVDLTTLNWTLSNQTSIYNTSFIQSNWIYMTSNNSYFNSVNITFLQFKSTSDSQSQSKIPLTFAGQLFYLDVGSMKYTIDIDGWEFDSRLNTLELITNITQPQRNDGCGELDIDFNNNNIVTNSTEFTSVYVGEDQAVVGKLINRALLDNVPRRISYKVQPYQSTDNNNNQDSDTPKQILSIITLIPNFNYKATLDPQFDLLINSDPEDNCASSSNSWKIIVGAVVGGIGLMAVGAGVTIHQRMQLKKKQYNLKLKKVSMEMNNGN
ncbi:hypothetical protein DFA_06836 [Cavenderia fasciculata]|uniref:ComC supersandwich domain-containing protein n=1 Tax=Cavenderia fasciculata TaxID=261658 RepID=F4Q2E9_CACFS|nr:uncharacterized protein DFA_06836 [Cavenderia fasciculata]EGG18169.1 hypothetical protein DFA_06836 [Cavenderia fasciculata]|eukprot:XP_004366210.1 hypothetical protein DFA_06836 [Cavenderia fasciculata]